MLKFEEVIYVRSAVADLAKANAKKVDAKKKFILVGDIGGTNSRFAVFKLSKQKPELLLYLKFASKEIANFSTVINQVLKYLEDKYKIKITKASFAAAGSVSSDREFLEITNLKPNLDVKDILKKTGLRSVRLLNDYQAVGYGLQVIDKKDIVPVIKAKSTAKSNKVILGAGTGLGKSILMWDENQKQQVNFPSEGGHGDFAPQSQHEFELLSFIKGKSGRNIEWEDVLSGDGIKNIYKFLEKKYKKNKYSYEIKKNACSPVFISKYRKIDPACKKTIELFVRFYARCAKNFALDTLAMGGVYITGKIAAENLDIFKHKTFIEEFKKSYKLKKLVAQIPVFVVKDYNVGLYGAASPVRKG